MTPSTLPHLSGMHRSDEHQAGLTLPASVSLGLPVADIAARYILLDQALVCSRALCLLEDGRHARTSARLLAGR